MKLTTCLVVVLATLCSSASAQRADGIYHIACIVEAGKCTSHPTSDALVAIGSKISFDVTTTQELMDEEGAPEVTELLLFVDGKALPGTHPIVEGQRDELLPPGSGDQEQDEVVTFRLTFPVTRDLSTPQGKENWSKLLGGLRKERKQVPVSVGLLNGPPLQSSYKVIFMRMSGTRLAAFLVIAALLAVAFLVVATRTGAIRDKEPAPSGEPIAPEDRTYSLSRTQVAVWTLLVVYAYLFVWMITGEYNTEIPRSILAILGISVATYGVAAGVDKEKQTTKKVTVSKTQNVFLDLFSNDTGASLHRVQFGLWSAVLMIVFAVTVYETLAMPDFDVSLLGLMGLTSAAYATMKIPETK